jgi:excisionase family DNA binding protein
MKSDRFCMCARLLAQLGGDIDRQAEKVVPSDRRPVRGSPATTAAKATRTAWSPAEFASKVGISVRTVRRMIASGQITSHKIGYLVRIPNAELERFEQVEGPDV